MKTNFKKRSFSVGGIMIFTALLFACQSPTGITQLTPMEFESSMNKTGAGKYILLDVRTPAEFTEGHIEGATNIDYNNSAFSANIATLDKNQAIYVYCRSGGRSASAASELKANGFTKIFELKGGIIAWEDSQHTIVK